jgi:hypothetical protein
MIQSKLQLLRRGDIKIIVLGANIFYSGAPELTPGLNSGVRVSRRHTYGKNPCFIQWPLVAQLYV